MRALNISKWRRDPLAAITANCAASPMLAEAVEAFGRQALTNRIATLRRRARDHDPVTGEVR